MKRFLVSTLLTTLLLTASADTLVFQWTDPNVPKADGYKLYQSTNSAGPFAVIATSTTNTVTLTNVPLTTLYWYVTCTNTRSESAPSTAISLPSAPSSPTGVRVIILIP